MTSLRYAEIGSSLLTFTGGVALTIEALTAGRRTRIKSAASDFKNLLASSGVPDLISDDRGEPLNSDMKIELWLSSRTTRLAQLGVTLLTLGFLVDLVVKLTSR